MDRTLFLSSPIAQNLAYAQISQICSSIGWYVPLLTTIKNLSYLQMWRWQKRKCDTTSKIWSYPTRVVSLEALGSLRDCFGHLSIDSYASWFDLSYYLTIAKYNRAMAALATWTGKKNREPCQLGKLRGDDPKLELPPKRSKYGSFGGDPILDRLPAVCPTDVLLLNGG